MLAIMVGNVGSGKSFLATELTLQDKSVVIVSRDAIVSMIAGGLYKHYDETKKDLYFSTEKHLITRALKERRGVIVDRTNESQKARKPYIDIAVALRGLKVVCYDFGAGTDRGLERRMASPRGQLPTDWMIVHQEIKSRYETPKKEEGIDKIILIPPHKG